MGWFDNSGTRIYYEEEGAGDPVLLLPGWGGTIAEFGQLRGALRERYRVIAADLPGSGKSEPQPRTYTPAYFEDDARAFLALIDQLAGGSAHVLGFSDGGEYGLLMATMQPDSVRSLITWGSAGKLEAMPGMVEAMHNMVDSPIPPMQGFSDYMKAAYGEEGARIMTQSFASTLTALIAAGGDISFSRAGAIRCPVLLLTGEHDFFAPPAVVRSLQQQIPGAEFIEVAGSEHDVHNARPEWLVETVMARLATTA